MPNTPETPSNKNNTLRKTRAVGFSILALAGALQLGRVVEDYSHRKPTLSEAEGLAHAGENIIAAEINLHSPVKVLNGVLTEIHKDGSEKIYANPIVVYSGNPNVHGKLDPANFHFFTATRVDGLPDVTEIEVTPDMQITAGQSITDPLTFDAILTSGSLNGYPDAYVVKSFPDELYRGSQGKGGEFAVGLPATEIGTALTVTSTGQ